MIDFCDLVGYGSDVVGLKNVYEMAVLSICDSTQRRKARIMLKNSLNHTPRVFFVLGLVGVAGLASPTLGQTLFEDFKVFGADGSSTDQFGVSSSIDGGVVAVGASAHRHDVGFSPKGSAYLFDVNTGNELFELLASDPQGFDQFGNAVSISNGIVVVGAVGDDDNGAASGSAYVFDALTGMQLFKLLADDGASGDSFGTSVATDGAFAVIGSNSGSAYVFDVKTGVQLFKILPDDGEIHGGFGVSVGISNGIVVVGAPLDDDPQMGQNVGSAYIFVAATGVQLHKLLPGNGAPQDHFGTAVGIGDGVVVVGSPNHIGNSGLENYGAAYVFSQGAGFQLFELGANDRADNDLFGESVAVASGMIVVGARANSDNGVGSGSAYVFGSQTGNSITKLLASDARELDFFGRSVGTSNGVVIVGANKGQGAQISSGAAYIFASISANSCPADLTGDGTLDFFDISALLTAFTNQDPIADFNNDGSLDFFDIAAFLTAFSAGCP